MKKQKIIVVLLIILTILFILIPYSNAALQSNGSTGTVQSIGSWIVNIRGMEALNGGMGLTETINGDLTPNTESNNLDIHMEKNTEYGAMAILSASSYGNPNKIASGGTTTGNKTGIVININKEWVAAGYLTGVSQFTNANAKYKNIYSGTESSSSPHTLSYTAKKGDAISETQKWHGASAYTWLSSTVNYNRNYNVSAQWSAGLLRAYSGSIFSYYGLSYNEHLSVEQRKTDAYYTKAWYSRAAMVCGEGI